MAEDVQAPEDEQEFSAWIDELEREEDKVVAVAEREDGKAQKQAQAKKAEHQENGVVTKSEYMADKFLAAASEEESRLFAIYRRGDEDPRQLEALIDLTRTKAAEAEKALSKEVDEKAEARATEIAAQDYGVGPIANGGVDSDTPEAKQYKDLWGRVQKDGDPEALVTLLAEDSEFISSVLSGQPIGKK